MVVVYRNNANLLLWRFLAPRHRIWSRASFLRFNNQNAVRHLCFLLACEYVVSEALGTVGQTTLGVLALLPLLELLVANRNNKLQSVFVPSDRHRATLETADFLAVQSERVARRVRGHSEGRP